MKEKIKTICLIIVCVIAVIAMSIWVWPKWSEGTRQPWVDRWESQMK